jgi:copper(I)-binding protein
MRGCWVKASIGAAHKYPKTFMSFTAALFTMAIVLPSHAESTKPSDSTITVSDAYAEPQPTVGANSEITAKVINHGTTDDKLRRVNCSPAFFSELRKTERGEGGIASSETKTILIPAQTSTELQMDGFHIVLLQTKSVLSSGDRFKCTFSFEAAGRKEVEVEVKKFGGK